MSELKRVSAQWHGRKFFQIDYDDGSQDFYFWCPGCRDCHFYRVPRWSFNGKIDLPSFAPSLRLFYRMPNASQEVTTCHLFLTDGTIRFCNDCRHALSGKQVPMQDIPDGYCIS